eukprot:TRINITY_DN13244_c0_g1_i1.p1 TRINITY_DN13244_c0_g1~~TRINITY_DN13244_c0_g1_i1.p1  ORF type:complete len:521 (+),score=265.98 TRINITY_DN13244_c0_g1_i1:51-1565(+)
MYDRSASPVRWAVLALACLAMFGSYYCYDNPTALHKPIRARYHNLSGVQYNLLYSVYSIPNVALPFFGGVLVDKFGTSITLFSFLLFIVAGQFVFAFSASIRSFPLALVGRTIFGFGGESLCVAQSTLLALWFRGKEMAFAMGLNLSIARLGSVVNDQVSPAIYHSHSVPAALWFGFFTCLMSLGATVILISVERWAARRAADSMRSGLLENENGADSDDQLPVEQLAHEEGNPAKPEADGSPSGDDGSSPNETIRLQDIKNFSSSFWIITASCVIVYATVLPFNNICGALMQTKYGKKLTTADRLLAIPFFISAAASPFLGGIVDKFGQRAILLTMSAAALMGAHLIMAFTMVNPIVPLAILGVAYSVYAAAIWPSVAYVVQERFLGTAYGLITAVQNAGLASTPIIVGVILDAGGEVCKTRDDCSHKKAGYEYVEIFFSSIAFVGVCLGVLLNVVDARNGGVLNKAQSQPMANVITVDDNDPLLKSLVADMSTSDDKAAIVA